jgi:hypothetical protein
MMAACSCLSPHEISISPSRPDFSSTILQRSQRRV